ncbi:MAG TPA: Crp/Fnr family transcriptional regulator [Sphingomicrobium sp.]
MDANYSASGAHPALEKFLARLVLRSPLRIEQQQAILNLPYRAVQVRARADVVSPGDTVSHATLVAKGLTARFDQMRDGRRQIVAFHVPGDMCDLHSVVAPTAAWGIASVSAATILEVPHSALRAIATTYPEIAIAFWRDAVVDGSILSKWNGNLGRQSARARLAHLLCEMGTRMEVAGLASRTCFALDATQEQLADALGLTAVHVNRTYQSLRRDGLIATHSHIAQIDDWSRLAEVGDFDPAYLLLDEPTAGERPDAEPATRYSVA